MTDLYYSPDVSGKRCFFASANTGNGFESRFGSIFTPGRFKRIYIIKGGPGTGKSTIMRRTAALAEKRGFQVEYYLCSSDVSSLDGIIIPGLSAAFIDGTAPHTAEAHFPGAAETLVDVGRFFDTPVLEARRAEIEDIFSRHSAYYNSGYRYLRAASEIIHDSFIQVCRTLNRQKLQAAALRLFDTVRGGARGEAEYKYISSIGPSGFCRLDTPERLSHRTVYVCGDSSSPYAFTEALAELVLSHNTDAVIFPALPDSRLTEGIYFKGTQTFVAVAPKCLPAEPDKRINMRRFINAGQLSELRMGLKFAEKLGHSILTGAGECFAKIAPLHAGLESIYSAAMDFKSCDGYINKLLKEFFGSL